MQRAAASLPGSGVSPDSHQYYRRRRRRGPRGSAKHLVTLFESRKKKYLERYTTNTHHRRYTARMHPTESEQKTRSTELNDLFNHVQQVNELADGYALRFPGDDTWANTLVQFITYERACCPFFTFALIFEPQQGSIWLQLRGPEGVKAIVENMLHS